MNALTRAAAAAAVALTAAGATSAATTTLTLTGSVSTVDATLAGTFHVGDPVSVTLRYDPATPVVASSPYGAVYDFLQFQMSFGSYQATFTSSAADNMGWVGIGNDVTGGPVGPIADAFGASVLGSHVSGAPVGGVPLQQGFFTLWDGTATALHDNSLPAQPSLAAFPSLDVAGLSFCATYTCGTGNLLGSVQANLTAMTVSLVPEPPPAALLLAGASLIGAWRRRRRR